MVWAYSENCHAEFFGVSQRKALKPSERWGANWKVEESSPAQACFSEALEHLRGRSSSQTTKPGEL